MVQSIKSISAWAAVCPAKLHLAATSTTFDFGEVGVDGLVSAKQVIASVGGKKDKYEKKATGVLDLNPNLVPGATINAEGIGVSMNVKDGKWSFGLNGDSLSINLFKNQLKLSSTKLKYENKRVTNKIRNQSHFKRIYYIQ